MNKTEYANKLMDIIAAAKDAAIRYYEHTGKPLGITGEVAEYEAARLLGLKLADARQAGYDAIQNVDGKEKKVQIKGRLFKKNSQRLGSIRLDKEWDTVLLVLLGETMDAFEMWEADRPAVRAALLAPGSKARNERGQLGVSKFKSIGTKVWPHS